MSVFGFFQFCISILHQKKRTGVLRKTCSLFHENERMFYVKRARILSETNRRFTMPIRFVNENNIDRNITLKFEDL